MPCSSRFPSVSVGCLPPARRRSDQPIQATSRTATARERPADSCRHLTTPPQPSTHEPISLTPRHHRNTPGIVVTRLHLPRAHTLHRHNAQHVTTLHPVIREPIPGPNHADTRARRASTRRSHRAKSETVPMMHCPSIVNVERLPSPGAQGSKPLTSISLIVPPNVTTIQPKPPPIPHPATQWPTPERPDEHHPPRAAREASALPIRSHHPPAQLHQASRLPTHPNHTAAIHTRAHRSPILEPHPRGRPKPKPPPHNRPNPRPVPPFLALALALPPSPLGTLAGL